MKIESGKDYSFLLNAPGQLDALFQGLGITMAPGVKTTAGKPYSQTSSHALVVPVPPAEWVVQTLRLPNGRDLLLQGLESRETLLAKMEADPYRYGYEPFPPLCARRCWDDADQVLGWGDGDSRSLSLRLEKTYRELLITTRNRNSKTEYAAKRVVKKLMEGGKIVWCLCQDNNTSTREKGQQHTIWRYLPPEVKALNTKRSQEFALSYGPKNRFAENSFLIPGVNGKVSECRFMNYEQKIETIEGGAIDLYWADELVPVDWVKTLKGRLIDREGKGLITFTPINGWNETYALVMQGSKVIEWQEFICPGFPGLRHWPGGPVDKVPYLVESAEDPAYAGMFFPADANPYVSYQSLVAAWTKATYEQKMIRLAGIARKKVGNRFPKFKREVHVVAAASIPEGGTNYCIIDFQGRNWFILWAKVLRIGDRKRIYIVRDWPDKKTYGEWAVRSDKPNGTRGPAQNAIGLGYIGYRNIILEVEGWTGVEMKDWSDGVKTKEGAIIIYKRLGDPRSGKAPTTTAEEGGTCNFDELRKVGIVVEAAPGFMINEGISKINDLLDYDEDQFLLDGRLTPLNEPQLFFSDVCENTIDCVLLWTGQGSEKEQASKDPIDDLRYLVTADPDDVPMSVLGSEGGGGY